MSAKGPIGDMRPAINARNVGLVEIYARNKNLLKRRFMTSASSLRRFSCSSTIHEENMKTHTSRYKIFAGLALSAGLVVVTAQSDVPVLRGISAIGYTHAHVRALHNQDGTIARGAHNEIATSNWSGYALANYATGLTYTAAQLNWTVPRVSYVLPPPVCHLVNIGRRTTTICTPPLVQAEYSASWVGIGGYCEDSNCMTVDNTLIQLGTAHNVSLHGATQYYAWIEMPPADPVIISPTYPNCNSLSCAYPVRPGDDITASLTCQQNCTPFDPNQIWVLAMQDKTQNWSWSVQVPFSSSLLSAVWIQEAPVSAAGVLPLADFRITKFVPTYNNNQAPNFPSGPNNTDGVDAILMIDPYGETSNPSVAEESPTVGGAFNVCWGNNPTYIGVCAAP